MSYLSILHKCYIGKDPYLLVEYIWDIWAKLSEQDAIVVPGRVTSLMNPGDYHILFVGSTAVIIKTLLGMESEKRYNLTILSVLFSVAFLFINAFVMLQVLHSK